MSDRKYVAGIDIETTGLDYREGHKIIEIYIVLQDLKSKSKVYEFYSRVNPCRPIDEAAREVHGISYQDVAHEPVWKDISKKVEAVMNKADLWVAHNGQDFDFPFIAYEQSKVGIVSEAKKIIDTMVLGRWATFSGKKPSLQELCEACDVSYNVEDAHEAKYDVEKMMECFWVGVKNGDWNRAIEEDKKRCT